MPVCDEVRRGGTERQQLPRAFLEKVSSRSWASISTFGWNRWNGCSIMFHCLPRLTEEGTEGGTAAPA
jgi:hypothetical protein